MDDIIRIIKSLENSSVLTDGVSKTVKHKIKKQEDGFLGMSLGNVGVSMLGNMLFGKTVVRAGKRVVRAGRVYNTMDRMSKSFYFRSIF